MSGWTENGLLQLYLVLAALAGIIGSDLRILALGDFLVRKFGERADAFKFQ
jgi:hypothetical protein